MIQSLPRLDLRVSGAFWMTVTVLVAVGANHVAEALTWHLDDMHVYRDAAQRLVEGEPLYDGGATPFKTYRYAPWYAFAWVPLSRLPAIEIIWSIAMLAASAACVWPVLRRDRLHLALFLMFAPLLFAISASGNVQPLMVAALIHGLPTKWGWVAVGLAASLKIAPLAFVAVFIAERRWWSVVGACLLTGALWAPLLLFTVDPATWDAAGIAATFPAPLWLASALTTAAVALYLALKRSHATLLAASLAAILALPRLFAYEITILLPALNHGSDADHSD